MKTEQEQLEFSLKQKEIAQAHSDLVSRIDDPHTEENQKIISASHDLMVKNMQELVYAYIGSDFHQIMKDKK